MTAPSAALEMGIHHTLLVRWRDETNLENMIRGNKKNKKSLHVGPDGVLLTVQDELHNWLFSKREQGIAIVTSHLVYKAAALLDATSGFKGLAAGGAASSATSSGGSVLIFLGEGERSECVSLFIWAVVELRVVSCAVIPVSCVVFCVQRC